MSSPSSSVAKQMLDPSLSILMVERLEMFGHRIVISQSFWGSHLIWVLLAYYKDASISIIVLNVNMINMVTLGQLLLLN